MLKVNGKKIIVSQLSDGSSIFSEFRMERSCGCEIIIQWNYENNSEIFALCALMRYLREFNSVVMKSRYYFILEMPYMPYLMSFEDKKEPPFTELKVFADIINNLNFDTVRIFDPYSENAELLLNNLNVSRATSGIYDAIRHIYKKKYGNVIMKELQPLTMSSLDFYFPDKKSFDKYSSLFYIENSTLSQYRHNRMFYRDGSKIFNKYGVQMEPWEMGSTSVLIICNMASSSEANIVQSIELLKNRYQESIYIYASHTDNSVMDDNSELVNMYRNGDFAKLYTSDSLYSLPNACSNNTGIDKYNMVEIIDY